LLREAVSKIGLLEKSTGPSKFAPCKSENERHAVRYCNKT
jgi:hypothetical protein